MDPAARLLDVERAPLVLKEESVVGHLLVNVLRQEHVAVLILVILVFFTVLDLFREVRHF